MPKSGICKAVTPAITKIVIAAEGTKTSPWKHMILRSVWYLFHADQVQGNENLSENVNFLTKSTSWLESVCKLCMFSMLSVKWILLLTILRNGFYCFMWLTVCGLKTAREYDARGCKSIVMWCCYLLIPWHLRQQKYAYWLNNLVNRNNTYIRHGGSWISRVGISIVFCASSNLKKERLNMNLKKSNCFSVKLK